MLKRGLILASDMISFLRDEKGLVIEESAFEYPTSGDANGAYNIARKGVMMLERIKKKSRKT